MFGVFVYGLCMCIAICIVHCFVHNPKSPNIEKTHNLFAVHHSAIEENLRFACVYTEAVLREKITIFGVKFCRARGKFPLRNNSEKKGKGRETGEQTKRGKEKERANATYRKCYI